MIDRPAPTSPNELVKGHGPTGGLIVRLQRYALVGWILFGTMLLFHLSVVFISSLVPRPVVAVDEAGRVLGNFEYLSPSARSDQELRASAMEFARLFLSLNSETIYNDYAAAMNMMCQELFNSTKEAIRADNYLRNVELAKTRSWLDFSVEHGGAAVLERKNLQAAVRVRGTLNVQGTGELVAKPFDMSLGLQIVPRNTLNTAGVCVAERRDN
jgi:hypothetical protein